MNQIRKMRAIGAGGVRMVNEWLKGLLFAYDLLRKTGSGILRYCSRPRRTTMAASFLVRVHSMSRRL